MTISGHKNDGTIWIVLIVAILVLIAIIGVVRFL